MFIYSLLFLLIYSTIDVNVDIDIYFHYFYLCRYERQVRSKPNERVCRLGHPSSAKQALAAE